MINHITGLPPGYSILNDGPDREVLSRMGWEVGLIFPDVDKAVAHARGIEGLEPLPVWEPAAAELFARADKLRGRAVAGAAYRLNGSPHEWTDDDSKAMALYVMAISRAVETMRSQAHWTLGFR